jgi:C4-dicarboxylate transporter, DctM subunit
MTIAALFVMLFAFMLIGMPVAVALGLSSLLTILLFAHDSLASLSLKLYETSEQFTLLAIPFFILAGAFMTTGGVAKRMIRFAIACVGHLRGGLAIASVLACMLFAAVSGSSPATVVAVGSIVIAGMVRAGYPLPFAAGVVCNAGTLGILIPPSIVMVVYGAATETSVGKLFMAGVIPGTVLGLMLMVAIYVLARIKKLPRQPWAGFGEIAVAARDSLWGLMLIVIILGGIYGGIFTPTEAAAVAAVYAFIVAVFVYRDIGLRQVPGVLVDAVRVTVMLMFIIANALLFAHVLTTERIPQVIAEQIVAWGMAPWAFLIVVNLLLLVAGAFMEPTGIILILAPILFPIAMRLGIDPVHLGIIMVVNLEIGMVTPPIGLNLFVTAGITKMSIGQVVQAALPWLAVLLLFLVIVTYVPQMALWLPGFLF